MSDIPPLDNNSKEANFYDVKRASVQSRVETAQDKPIKDDDTEQYSVWDSIMGRDKHHESEEDVAKADENLKLEEDAEDLSQPIPQYFFLLTIVPFFAKVQ